MVSINSGENLDIIGKKIIQNCLLNFFKMKSCNLVTAKDANFSDVVGTNLIIFSAQNLTSKCDHKILHAKYKYSFKCELYFEFWNFLKKKRKFFGSYLTKFFSRSLFLIAEKQWRYADGNSKFGNENERFTSYSNIDMVQRSHQCKWRIFPVNPQSVASSHRIMKM